jgi:sorting nexin-4
MQEEVSAAAETSDAFSDETLKEHAVFQHAKQAEMKEMLSAVADGQIEMYKKACLALEVRGLPRANLLICSRQW